MAQETINLIRETELKAQEIVETAKVSGSEIISKAKEEAKQFRENELAVTKKNADTVVNAVEAGMEKTLIAAEERASTAISNLLESSAAKKSEAIKMIIDYISK